MNTPHQHNTLLPPLKTEHTLKSRGFGIVELMIGMTLGLFLIGGVISVFIANQEAARTTESLSRIQENTRLAFELMAREIRESGGSACDPAPAQTVNVITGASSWWAATGAGIRGYEGSTVAPFAAFGTTSAADRVNNTDALSLSHSSDSVPVLAHNPWAQQGLGIAPGNNPFEVGDIVNVCNAAQGAIFYVLAVSANGFNPTPPGGAPSGGWGGVFYGQGCASPSVCNCSEYLGGTSAQGCNNRNNNGDNGKNNFTYPVGSTLAKVGFLAWYVGYSGRNDARGNPINSLFRVENAGAPQEIVEGVADLQIQYISMDPHLRVPTANAAYQDAGAVGNWANVVAVRLTLTLSDPAVGTRTDTANGARLSRTMSQTITIRNRAL